MNVEEQIDKKISEFFSWINLPIVQNHYIKKLTELGCYLRFTSYNQ